jgi:uncharacterized protein
MWFNYVLIIAIMLFIIVLIIKRFAYFRPDNNFLSPREKYEELYYGNLHSWYRQVPSSQGVKIILFCHGNAGNLSQRQEKLEQLYNLGYSVLIFDYSGYGQSKGVPNEQLCYSNASMFVQLLLQKGYKQEDIVPYGESIGASIAVHVAKRYGLPKIILESALPSIKELLKYWYSWLGSILGIIFCEFNTTSSLSSYKGKSLVIHSVHDEVIPYECTTELQNQSTIFIPSEGNHTNVVIPWDKVKEFINN